MSKSRGEFEKFSIDEIIAEIKSEAEGSTPPPVSAPEKQQTPPKAPPKPQEAPPEGPDDVRIAAGHIPGSKTFGKRLKPGEITIAQRIIEEEERIIEKERLGKQAPWHTESGRMFTQVNRQDTQEFEITLESMGTAQPLPDDEEEGHAKASKGRRRYDFLNMPYDDAAAAVRALEKRMKSMTGRVLLILPLLAAATYMTVCMPMGLPMPFGFTYLRHPYLYLLALAALDRKSVV